MKLDVSFPEYATSSDMLASYAAARAALYAPVKRCASVSKVVDSGEGPVPPTFTAEQIASPSVSLRGGPEPTTERPSVRQIQDAVCDVFGVGLNDIRGARRFRHLVMPRQVAMAVSRQLTGWSLLQIGRLFGGRDHATVLHAVCKLRSVVSAVPVCLSLRDYIVALQVEVAICPPVPPKRGVAAGYWQIVKGRSGEGTLDVYLIADSPPTSPQGGSGIFVHRNGRTVEMSRQEWDRAFPGQEPVVLATEYGMDCTVYQANITHNLGKMADAAGLYKPLWCAQDDGIERAETLIEPLTVGLAKLRQEPDAYRVHNPSNGWGDYDGLVNFVEAYLAACKRYPLARISVSR